LKNILFFLSALFFIGVLGIVGYLYYTDVNSNNYFGNNTVGNGYWLSSSNPNVVDIEATDSIQGQIAYNGTYQEDGRYKLYVQTLTNGNRLNIVLPQAYVASNSFLQTSTGNNNYTRSQVSNFLNYFKSQNFVLIDISKSLKGSNKDLFIKNILITPI